MPFYREVLFSKRKRDMTALVAKLESSHFFPTFSREVGIIDSHVALVVLRFCGSFSKPSYIARTTPPTHQHGQTYEGGVADKEVGGGGGGGGLMIYSQLQMQIA